MTSTPERSSASRAFTAPTATRVARSASRTRRRSTFVTSSSGGMTRAAAAARTGLRTVMATATVSSRTTWPRRVATEEEKRSSMASMSAVVREIESPTGVRS
jgi:hypothetical protein